jgi:hypothetical protein
MTDEKFTLQTPMTNFAKVRREEDVTPSLAQSMGLDAETIQTLLDLLNPLHGELDRQTYDEKVRDDFDAPRDKEYSINITGQMEADLTQAVLILENRKRAALAPGNAGAVEAWHPTAAQIASACLSYRHDFGLLDDEQRKTVKHAAVEWLRAWQKEGAGSDRNEIIERCARVVDHANREGPYQAIAAASRIRALAAPLPATQGDDK